MKDYEKLSAIKVALLYRKARKEAGDETSASEDKIMLNRFSKMLDIIKEEDDVCIQGWRG